MKFAVVFACFIVASVAAPLDDSKNAQILRYEVKICEFSDKSAES